LEGRVFGTDPLSELLKQGARKLLSQAVESEVQDLLAQNSRLCAGLSGFTEILFIKRLFAEILSHSEK